MQAVYYQSMLMGGEIAPVDITYTTDFFSFVEMIMYLGTNMEEELSEKQRALIVKTDLVVRPFLQDSMNHALRMSSYQL